MRGLVRQDWQLNAGEDGAMFIESQEDLRRTERFANQGFHFQGATRGVIVLFCFHARLVAATLRSLMNEIPNAALAERPDLYRTLFYLAVNESLAWLATSSEVNLLFAPKVTF